MYPKLDVNPVTLELFPSKIYQNKYVFMCNQCHPKNLGPICTLITSPPQKGKYGGSMLVFIDVSWKQ